MKKFISWDIFHLSLILSLLRLYPELYRSSYFENQPLEQEVFLGPSSAYTQTHFHNLNNRLNGGYIHPKNIDDSLVRSLFIHDLHRLSNRPSWANHRPQNDIIAYIVNGQQPLSSVNTTGSNNESHNQQPIEVRVTEDNIQSELTQEDMDLIEILWKQDIDLGISRNVFDGTWNQELTKEKDVNASDASDKKESQPTFENPWQGLHYSIDSETGEHIILPPTIPSSPIEQQDGNPSQEVPTVDFLDITLEEALQFFETESAEIPQIKVYDQREPDVLVNERHLSLLEELKDLQDLVAESQSNDSAWEQAMHLSQALGANRFEIEPSIDLLTNSTPSYVDALLRNSSLPLAIEEQASSSDLSYNQPIEFCLNNEEDEVDNILSMLTNGTDPDPFASIAAQYSGDNPMDILPGNITTDNDLISSILSQESLDFINLTRMVDESTNGVFLASDDSAISSNESKHAMDWFGSSVSNQGDSACSDTNTNNTFGNQENNRSTFTTPIAQKKYHFFGKHTSDNESSNETTSDSGCSNSVSSYSNSPKKSYNFVDYPKTPPISNAESLQPYLHNHTYHQAPSATQKPIERNKDDDIKEEDKDEERCRDEKRARELNLPLTIKEITCMPIEEFNERMTKLDLNDEQLTLVRDIRRRGKNKVAAQNCRKRKMDQIVNLQKRLEDLQYDREKLMTEQAAMNQRRSFLQSKYHRLYQYLFDKTNSDPSDPPLYFSGAARAEAQRPQDFPIGRNGTSFNQELEGDSNKGARVKRKVNKNK